MYETTGYATGGSYKKCEHTGEEYIYQTEDGLVTLAGADKYGIEPGYADLILDFAEVMDLTKKFVKPIAPADWQQLNNFMLPTATVVPCSWADQGAPTVGLGFWIGAWSLMRKMAKESQLGSIHTICCCFGGHGRTGTGLCSLIIADSMMGVKEAVDLVRSLHCDKAVESQAQMRYLTKLVAARGAWRKQQKAMKGKGVVNAVKETPTPAVAKAEDDKGEVPASTVDGTVVIP